MYQALYRKWRPQTFDDVIGQKHITETLKNQVAAGRLSHAYMFIGTRGTGKTTCARILARAVNCEHPEGGNPCGKCAACRGIADGSVLDVVELDAASNNGVDNVRALREEAVFSPAAVRKRVYIIDEVHMLSTAAFNALLKILEEPPEHLMFILATTELQKVPATILSRCQRHSFRRVDAAELSAYVSEIARRESLELTDEAAGLIARLAEGGVRDALSLLDQCSVHKRIDADAVYSTMGLAGKRRIEQLLDSVIARDAESAVRQFTALWMDGKDPVGVLEELFMLLRDSLMLRIAPKAGLELISGAHDAAALRSYAKRLTTEELNSAMATLRAAAADAKNASNPRSAAELCLITLCSGMLKNDMNEFNARLSRLEARAADGTLFAAPARTERDDEPDDGGHGAAERPAAEAPEETWPDEPDDDRGESDEDSCLRNGPDEPEDDGPDAELFREEQPEDSFTDREMRAAAQSAPQPAAPAADGDPLFWERLCAAIVPKLPADMRIYPGDASKLRGRLCGNVLTLEAESGFIYNRFNRTEILQRFTDCARELAGRPVNTVLRELRPSAREARSLDELKRFPETRVIG